VFEVVEGVVDEELQFGDDAELVAYAVAQFEADAALVVVEVLDDLRGLLRGEDADVGPGDAEVGG